MKRLLAYLFLVLGLGFVFSVNANAEVIKYKCKYNGIERLINFSILKDKNRVEDENDKYEIVYENTKYILFYNPYGFEVLKKHTGERFRYLGVTKGQAIAYLKEGKEFPVHATCQKLNETQIAKAEPSQTQEVASVENIKNYLPNVIYCYNYWDKTVTAFLSADATGYQGGCLNKEISYKLFKKSIKSKSFCFRYKGSPALSWNTNSCDTSNSNWTSLKHDGKNLYYSLEQTQIAKKEPSQADTIKPNIVIASTVTFKDPDYVLTGKVTDKGGSEKTYLFYQKGGGNKRLVKLKNGKFKIKRFSLNNEEIKLIAIDEYRNETTKVVKVIIAMEEETQIAKKEPTIKPKKKKKVKVAETTQEEFKPEDKDIDNDAPVIEIAEAITVDSQAYTLKGKVKDKSKIYLTIDGRQVQVKKGKFKIDRFNIDPGEVEEIKIVAIDKWNNKSEKTIKVTIDLKSTELARSFEDLKPNSIRVKTDKNKIAIIIGIEKYANLINLDAKYANRDAKAFRTYATQALGVKASNIKILVDDKATRSQTLKAFKLWLPRIAGDGGKDILIFFAGHGLASDNGEDLYILPQDGESSLLEDTAISRVELISLVQKVNPKSVTMFFDTCYSGQTRDERMLVASLRPLRIVADEQDTPNNFTIFTASNYDQTSGSIEEAKHGMFSYYLMKGLEGKADTNRDKKITNGELIAYLKTNVSKEAFTQNREQDPMLSGDPDQVLMSYR